jgi:hypothetical protein
MSVVHRRFARRSLSVVVTLTLLVAVFLTLMHWHEESASQRCEICFARQLPSIYVPFAGWLALPTRVEWQSPVEKPIIVRSAYFQLNTSRAPPLT